MQSDELHRSQTLSYSGLEAMKGSDNPRALGQRMCGILMRQMSGMHVQEVYGYGFLLKSKRYAAILLLSIYEANDTLIALL